MQRKSPLVDARAASLGAGRLAPLMALGSPRVAPQTLALAPVRGLRPNTYTHVSEICSCDASQKDHVVFRLLYLTPAGANWRRQCCFISWLRTVLLPTSSTPT